MLELAGGGLVHGPAHSSIGQEGGAVGSALALRASDQVNGSHRGHHQFLAKALAYVAPARPRPRRARVPASVQDGPAAHARRDPRARRRATAAGAAARCTCSGSRPARSAPTRSSAAACRWRPATPGRSKHAGTGDVAVTYFGDGAVNIGSVLETHEPRRRLEAAGLLLHREQPLRRLDARSRRSTARDRACPSRGPGFGIPRWRVDGMDPLAVHLAMQRGARRSCAPATGPTVIEAEVYRYFHQNGPLPGQRLRLPHQGGGGGVARARPARPRRRARCMRRGLAHRGRGRRGPRAGARRRWPRSATSCSSRPDGKPASAASCRRCGPTRASSTSASAATSSELDGARYARADDRSTGADRRSKFIDAVAAVMGRADGDGRARSSCMGEDVHRLNGGTNGATRGWPSSSPTACSAPRSARTRSPGSAGGMALDGRFRPVVEFMYPDFMWVAADQVFNQIGKARHMFGGDERGAARAAHQGRDGHRLRLAALDGPGRHLRHVGPAGASSRRRRRSTTSA